MEKEKQWHAIYVASRQEKNSCRLLLEKGIEAYVPLIKTMKQWSDRKKMVEFPLMNGYVFVLIDSSEKEKTLQTKGVVNFVRSEGKHAILREAEIERLKQLIELGYQMESAGIQKNFEEGEKVKIGYGPLKGVEGFVIENGEGKFITIILESIGQGIRVKLPKDILLSTQNAAKMINLKLN
ncbi:MAG TPA: UpxY family transcription antiterminator [Bacteroidia bacterium]|jgi:transcriptional antiterminator NusG|nr:UpxY family transcription antiterminator [Bacteroidia bacterium]